MEYRKLGNSDLEVPAIGLGTWAMGGDMYGDVDDKKSIETIKTAVNNGITLIDTAPAYGAGHAEEIVGKAIKEIKDKVILATKCGTYKTDGNFYRDLSPKIIRKQLEKSLTALGVETIDLYQIHWPDPDTPLEKTVEELIRLKEQGKFRYLGVSNFDTELLEEISGLTDIVSLQPQYSILHRDIEEKILPYTQNNNIGILAYGPLGGGILTGKYREQPPADKRGEFYPFFKEPQWSRVQDLITLLEDIADSHNQPIAHVAINWVKQQQGITSVLVGCKSPEQAKQNARAGDWNLKKKEIKEIDQAYRDIFHK
ncbi:MAG: aldo/keto reductase [Halanaerobiales bacterium]